MGGTRRRYRAHIIDIAIFAVLTGNGIAEREYKPVFVLSPDRPLGRELLLLRPMKISIPLILLRVRR